MHFFAEAICILLRLYAGLCENIDHLSPAEARARNELGNISVQLKLELGLSLAIKTSMFFMKLIVNS